MTLAFSRVIFPPSIISSSSGRIARIFSSVSTHSMSVNYVGRTSMEVGVRVEAEHLMTGVRRHTNSCYLTYVAIDALGHPVEVPRLICETPDEIRRNEAAKERRRRRLEERTAENRG
jgi:acyl-CoA hydrolase